MIEMRKLYLALAAGGLAKIDQSIHRPLLGDRRGNDDSRIVQVFGPPKILVAGQQIGIKAFITGMTTLYGEIVSEMFLPCHAQSRLLPMRAGLLGGFIVHLMPSIPPADAGLKSITEIV